MPGLDGTGPMGAGPMTGRGLGYCNPAGVSYGWPRLGLGLGRGFRGGLGFRGRFFRAGWYGAPYYAPYYGNPYGYSVSAKDEATMLRNEANAMKEQLDAINRRIQELESGSSGT